MADIQLLALFLMFGFVSCDLGNILQIHYPDISLEADDNGNITLQSGADASVYLIPGPGGTVYFEGEDILHLIKVINGLPPVWKDHSSIGFFKTAFGGDNVNVKLEALDPDNQEIQYSLVAGTMPPGLMISNNSEIAGRVPDLDAIYSFTIRATNVNDKYADAVFRMQIIERNQCLPTPPCKNGATCVDQTGNIPYKCICPDRFSGMDCEKDCRSNSLEVNSTVAVPQAMMSAYLTRENYTATDGRLGSTSGDGKGWCGADSNSWLQIDLGQQAHIFGAVMQSYSSAYYTGSYFLSYSVDGATFMDVENIANVTSSTSTASSVNKFTFAGSSSSSSATDYLPLPVHARFVRFHPVSYSSSKFPCMRVDLLGCVD
ncbi:uncharacterized protein LOC128218739 [Mya arenaria]|uniref:uncharacterized protein LOC128218739 n=1 Tax=Mya arenaria TaxID=6604 RepID=UPI0022E4D34E|nr:uncharacterized protein LOC128218739 [Mya arenaria]